MGSTDVLLINLPMNRKQKAKFAERKGVLPLGILYIAAVLTRNNISVKVLDYLVEQQTKSQMKEFLIKHAPKVIGFSTYTESWSALKVMSQLVKDTLPDAILVAGGAFANFCYDDILKFTSIDYVIRGEGEYALLDLCRYVFNNELNKIPSVTGLVYKAQSGKLIINPTRRIMNLDELPFPARSLVDLSKYIIPTIVTSRGCVAQCIFCSSKAFWGKQIKLRSVDNILAEIVLLYKDYGYNVFQIVDDTFTLSKRRVFEFCEKIKKTGIAFNWGCETRADVITEELIVELKKAGCTKMNIGLESGDDEILRKLKKSITIEQFEKGIQYGCKHGLSMSCGYIIGHAFDTHESIRKTLDYVRYMQKKYHIVVTGTVNTPYPGTEQYTRAKELGIEIQSRDWDDFQLSNTNISTANVSKKELEDYLVEVHEIMNQNFQA